MEGEPPAYFDSLPIELLIHITSFLDGTSVYATMLVSREWNNITDHVEQWSAVVDRFVKNHAVPPPVEEKDSNLPLYERNRAMPPLSIPYVRELALAAIERLSIMKDLTGKEKSKFTYRALSTFVVVKPTTTTAQSWSTGLEIFDNEFESVEGAPKRKKCVFENIRDAVNHVSEGDLILLLPGAHSLSGKAKSSENNPEDIPGLEDNENEEAMVDISDIEEKEQYVPVDLDITKKVEICGASTRALLTTITIGKETLLWSADGGSIVNLVIAPEDGEKNNIIISENSRVTLSAELSPLLNLHLRSGASAKLKRCRHGKIILDEGYRSIDVDKCYFPVNNEAVFKLKDVDILVDKLKNGEEDVIIDHCHTIASVFETWQSNIRWERENPASTDLSKAFEEKNVLGIGIDFIQDAKSSAKLISAASVLLAAMGGVDNRQNDSKRVMIMYNRNTLRYFMAAIKRHMESIDVMIPVMINAFAIFGQALSVICHFNAIQHKEDLDTILEYMDTCIKEKKRNGMISACDMLTYYMEDPKNATLLAEKGVFDRVLAALESNNELSNSCLSVISNTLIKSQAISDKFFTKYSGAKLLKRFLDIAMEDKHHSTTEYYLGIMLSLLTRFCELDDVQRLISEAIEKCPSEHYFKGLRLLHAFCFTSSAALKVAKYGALEWLKRVVADTAIEDRDAILAALHLTHNLAEQQSVRDEHKEILQKITNMLTSVVPRLKPPKPRFVFMRVEPDTKKNQYWCRSLDALMSDTTNIYY